MYSWAVVRGSSGYKQPAEHQQQRLGMGGRGSSHTLCVYIIQIHLNVCADRNEEGL